MDGQVAMEASQASGPAPRDAVQARRRRCEILSLTAALAVVFVAAKAALLPFAVSTIGELVRWGLRLAIVVAPDLCFAAALAALGLLSTLCVASRPRCRAMLRTLWLLVFCLSGIYAVASVAIYRATMVPLTIPLLSFVGGPSIMASSIQACLSAEAVVGLLLVPVALLLAPRVASRLPWFREGAPLPARAVVALLCLVALYGLVCRSYVQAQWTDPNRWERRIAQSPHYVLLASCVRELFRAQALTPDIDIKNARIEDFQPAKKHGRALTDAIPPDERPRNVLVVLMESTSVEYLELYGGRFATTPHLSRLAKAGGVVFENAYVQTPNSCKSLIGLTASVYPRLDWWLTVRDCPDFDVPTLPQILSRRGFRTCFAHSGYWKWKDRDQYLRRRGVQKLIDADSLGGAKVNSWGVSDRAMYQSVLDWIDEEKNKPFYALAYTIETHHPYVAREPLRDFGVEDPELNRYLNALAAADENLAWLMEQLKQRGLDKSTLVVVTADHGESFGGHGHRVHSFCTYESTVHVPLVMLHPSLANLPDRIKAVCQQIDLAPTVADLLGVPQPEIWQGRHLFDAGNDGRAYFFTTGNEVILGLREGDWKYHYYVESRHEELFNMRQDPTESQNQAEKHRQRCEMYRRRLGSWVLYQRKFLAQHGAP